MGISDEHVRLYELLENGNESQFIDFIANRPELVARKEPLVGDTLLHCAARTNSSRATCALLAAGASVDEPDHTGLTPLHVAAQAGSVAVAAELVRQNADLGARCNNGYTPLFIALGQYEDGSRKVAQLLMQRNCPVDLASALLLGDKDRIVAMFTADPHLLSKTTRPEDQFGNLIAAAIDRVIYAESPEEAQVRQQDFEDILHVLLRHGLNVHDRDSLGGPPLHRSVQFSQLGAGFTRILLEHGADKNAIASNGQTALEAAEDAGNSSALALLRDWR